MKYDHIYVPTVPLMVGKLREENTTFQPTLIGAVLESTRKIMQAIQAIRRPVTKHDWCMASDTAPRSVKYLRKNPISMPCNIPTKKTDTVEKVGVEIPSSHTTKRRR